MRRLVTAAIALAIAALTALPGSAAAAGTTNGPLYVPSFFGNATLRGTDGNVVTNLTFGGTGVFSPAGDRVALIRLECSDDACSTQMSSVVVRDHLGSETAYGPFNEQISEITWSPDGTQVAFVATNNTDGTDRIYRLPLTATEPVPIFTEQDEVRYIDQFSQIDWKGGNILFVGGRWRTDEGTTWLAGVDSEQLYEVPAAGGEPTEVNVHYDPECTPGAGACYYTFVDPQWSPDGTKIVAEMTEESGAGSSTRFLGTITPGAKVPTELTALTGDTSIARPQWSPDGTHVIFRDDDANGTYAALISAAGTGRTKLPASVMRWTSWQPCPGGVCASWAATRLPSKITLSVSSGNGRVKASGVVTPDKTGQTLSITLKKLVGSTWKKVATAKPVLKTGSKYTASWKQPTVEKCSLKASYPGDATHLPSTTTLLFYC